MAGINLGTSGGQGGTGKATETKVTIPASTYKTGTSASKTGSSTTSINLGTLGGAYGTGGKASTTNAEKASKKSPIGSVSSPTKTTSSPISFSNWFSNAWSTKLKPKNETGTTFDTTVTPTSSTSSNTGSGFNTTPTTSSSDSSKPSWLIASNLSQYAGKTDTTSTSGTSGETKGIELGRLGGQGGTGGKGSGVEKNRQETKEDPLSAYTVEEWGRNQGKKTAKDYGNNFLVRHDKDGNPIYDIYDSTGKVIGTTSDRYNMVWDSAQAWYDDIIGRFLNNEEYAKSTEWSDFEERSYRVAEVKVTLEDLQRFCDLGYLDENDEDVKTLFSAGEGLLNSLIYKDNLYSPFDDPFITENDDTEYRAKYSEQAAKTREDKGGDGTVYNPEGKSVEEAEEEYLAWQRMYEEQGIYADGEIVDYFKYKEELNRLSAQLDDARAAEDAYNQELESATADLEIERYLMFGLGENANYAELYETIEDNPPEFLVNGNYSEDTKNRIMSEIKNYFGVQSGKLVSSAEYYEKYSTASAEEVDKLLHGLALLSQENQNAADYGKGNIDLNSRGIVTDENGKVSTLGTISFIEDTETSDGQKTKSIVLIPTVVQNENGEWVKLSDDDAIAYYKSSGEYLGKFANQELADKYSEKIQKKQDELYGTEYSGNRVEIKRNLEDANNKKAEAEERLRVYDSLPNVDDRDRAVWEKQLADAEADIRIYEKQLSITEGFFGTATAGLPSGEDIYDFFLSLSPADKENYENQQAADRQKEYDEALDVNKFKIENLTDNQKALYYALQARKTDIENSNELKEYQRLLAESLGEKWSFKAGEGGKIIVDNAREKLVSAEENYNKIVANEDGQFSSIAEYNKAVKQAEEEVNKAKSEYNTVLKYRTYDIGNDEQFAKKASDGFSTFTKEFSNEETIAKSAEEFKSMANRLSEDGNHSALAEYMIKSGWTDSWDLAEELTSYIKVEGLDAVLPNRGMKNDSRIDNFYYLVSQDGLAEALLYSTRVNSEINTVAKEIDRAKFETTARIADEFGYLDTLVASEDMLSTVSILGAWIPDVAHQLNQVMNGVSYVNDRDNRTAFEKINNDMQGLNQYLTNVWQFPETINIDGTEFKIPGIGGKDAGFFNSCLVSSLQSSLALGAAALTGGALGALFPTALGATAFAGTVFEQSVQSIITKGVVDALFMGSVMAQTTTQKLEEGKDIKEAWLTGLTAGVAEALFETLSLDLINPFGNLAPSTMKETIARIIMASGVEGSEEVFTDLANLMTDRWINKDESEYERNIQNYISQGFTKEEATKLAAKDVVNQVADSFVAGAISSVGSIGTRTVSQYFSAKHSGEVYNSLPAIDGQTFAVSFATSVQKAYDAKFFDSTTKENSDAIQELCGKILENGQATNSEISSLVSIVDSVSSEFVDNFLFDNEQWGLATHTGRTIRVAKQKLEGLTNEDLNQWIETYKVTVMTDFSQKLLNAISTSETTSEDITAVQNLQIALSKIISGDTKYSSVQDVYNALNAGVKGEGEFAALKNEAVQKTVLDHVTSSVGTPGTRLYDLLYGSDARAMENTKTIENLGRFLSEAWQTARAELYSAARLHTLGIVTAGEVLNESKKAQSYTVNTGSAKYQESVKTNNKKSNNAETPNKATFANGGLVESDDDWIIIKEKGKNKRVTREEYIAQGHTNQEFNDYADSHGSNYSHAKLNNEWATQDKGKAKEDTTENKAEETSEETKEETKGEETATIEDIKGSVSCKDDYTLTVKGKELKGELLEQVLRILARELLVLRQQMDRAQSNYFSALTKNASDAARYNAKYFYEQAKSKVNLYESILKKYGREVNESEQSSEGRDETSSGAEERGDGLGVDVRIGRVSREGIATDEAATEKLKVYTQDAGFVLGKDTVVLKTEDSELFKSVEKAAKRVGIDEVFFVYGSENMSNINATTQGSFGATVNGAAFTYTNEEGNKVRAIIIDASLEDNALLKVVKHESFHHIIKNVYGKLYTDRKIRAINRYVDIAIGRSNIEANYGKNAQAIINHIKKHIIECYSPRYIGITGQLTDEVARARIFEEFLADVYGNKESKSFATEGDAYIVYSSTGGYSLTTKEMNSRLLRRIDKDNLEAQSRKAVASGNNTSFDMQEDFGYGVLDDFNMFNNYDFLPNPEAIPGGYKGDAVRMNDFKAAVADSIRFTDESIALSQSDIMGDENVKRLAFLARLIGLHNNIFTYGNAYASKYGNDVLDVDGNLIPCYGVSNSSKQNTVMLGLFMEKGKPYKYAVPTFYHESFHGTLTLVYGKGEGRNKAIEKYLRSVMDDPRRWVVDSRIQAVLNGCLNAIGEVYDVSNTDRLYDYTYDGLVLVDSGFKLAEEFLASAISYEDRLISLINYCGLDTLTVYENGNEIDIGLDADALHDRALSTIKKDKLLYAARFLGIKANDDLQFLEDTYTINENTIRFASLLLGRAYAIVSDNSINLDKLPFAMQGYLIHEDEAKNILLNSYNNLLNTIAGYVDKHQELQPIYDKISGLQTSNMSEEKLRALNRELRKAIFDNKKLFGSEANANSIAIELDSTIEDIINVASGRENYVIDPYTKHTTPILDVSNAVENTFQVIKNNNELNNFRDNFTTDFCIDEDSMSMDLNLNEQAVNWGAITSDNGEAIKMYVAKTGSRGYVLMSPFVSDAMSKTPYFVKKGLNIKKATFSEIPPSFVINNLLNAMIEDGKDLAILYSKRDGLSTYYLVPDPTLSLMNANTVVFDAYGNRIKDRFADNGMSISDSVNPYIAKLVEKTYNEELEKAKSGVGTSEKLNYLLLNYAAVNGYSVYGYRGKDGSVKQLFGDVVASNKSTIEQLVNEQNSRKAGSVERCVINPGVCLSINSNLSSVDSLRNIIESGEYNLDKNAYYVAYSQAVDAYKQAVSENKNVTTTRLFALEAEKTYLSSLGYDTVAYKNTDGAVNYMVLNPNNVKSVDLEITDENGKTVPLQDRFAKSSNVEATTPALLDGSSVNIEDQITYMVLKKALEYDGQFGMDNHDREIRKLFDNGGITLKDYIENYGKAYNDTIIRDLKNMVEYSSPEYLNMLAEAYRTRAKAIKEMGYSESAETLYADARYLDYVADVRRNRSMPDNSLILNSLNNTDTSFDIVENDPVFDVPMNENMIRIVKTSKPFRGANMINMDSAMKAFRNYGASENDIAYSGVEGFFNDLKAKGETRVSVNDLLTFLNNSNYGLNTFLYRFNSNSEEENKIREDILNRKNIEFEKKVDSLNSDIRNLLKESYGIELLSNEVYFAKNFMSEISAMEGESMLAIFNSTDNRRIINSQRERLLSKELNFTCDDLDNLFTYICSYLPMTDAEYSEIFDLGTDRLEESSYYKRVYNEAANSFSKTNSGVSLESLIDRTDETMDTYMNAMQYFVCREGLRLYIADRRFVTTGNIENAYGGKYRDVITKIKELELLESGWKKLIDRYSFDIEPQWAGHSNNYLTDYKELVIQDPSLIGYWNSSMKTHYSTNLDETGLMSFVRFGVIYDKSKNADVLYIDEIQSDIANKSNNSTIRAELDGEKAVIGRKADSLMILDTESIPEPFRNIESFILYFNNIIDRLESSLDSVNRENLESKEITVPSDMSAFELSVFELPILDRKDEEKILSSLTDEEKSYLSAVYDSSKTNPIDKRRIESNGYYYFDAGRRNNVLTRSKPFAQLMRMYLRPSSIPSFYNADVVSVATPSTERYMDIATRAMLNYAVANGYSRIDWITPEDSSKRWHDVFGKFYEKIYESDFLQAINKYQKAFGGEVGVGKGNRTLVAGNTEANYYEIPQALTDYIKNELATHESEVRRERETLGDCGTSFSISEDAPPSSIRWGFKLMEVDENGTPYAYGYSQSLENGMWYDADTVNVQKLMSLDKGYAYLVDKDANIVDKLRVNKTTVDGNKSRYVNLPSAMQLNSAQERNLQWVVVSDRANGDTVLYNVASDVSGNSFVYSMIPGFQVTDMPTMTDIGETDGKERYRLPNQRWFLVEYASDRDYNIGAYKSNSGDIETGVPTNGWYSLYSDRRYGNGQNHIVTGRINIVGALSESDIRAYVDKYGYEGVQTDLEWRDGKIYDDNKNTVNLTDYVEKNIDKGTPSRKQAEAELRPALVVESLRETYPEHELEKEHEEIVSWVENPNGKPIPDLLALAINLPADTSFDISEGRIFVLRSFTPAYEYEINAFAEELGLCGADVTDNPKRAKETTFIDREGRRYATGGHEAIAGMYATIESKEIADRYKKLLYPSSEKGRNNMDMREVYKQALNLIRVRGNDDVTRTVVIDFAVGEFTILQQESLKRFIVEVSDSNDKILVSFPGKLFPNMLDEQTAEEYYFANYRNPMEVAELICERQTRRLNSIIATAQNYTQNNILYEAKRLAEEGLLDKMDEMILKMFNEQAKILELENYTENYEAKNRWIEAEKTRKRSKREAREEAIDNAQLKAINRDAERMKNSKAATDNYYSEFTEKNNRGEKVRKNLSDFDPYGEKSNRRPFWDTQSKDKDDPFIGLHYTSFDISEDYNGISFKEAHKEVTDWLNNPSDKPIPDLLASAINLPVDTSFDISEPRRDAINSLLLSTNDTRSRMLEELVSVWSVGKASECPDSVLLYAQYLTPYGDVLNTFGAHDKIEDFASDELLELAEQEKAIIKPNYIQDGIAVFPLSTYKNLVGLIRIRGNDRITKTAVVDFGLGEFPITQMMALKKFIVAAAKTNETLEVGYTTVKTPHLSEDLRVYKFKEFDSAEDLADLICFEQTKRLNRVVNNVLNMPPNYVMEEQRRILSLPKEELARQLLEKDERPSYFDDWLNTIFRFTDGEISRRPLKEGRKTVNASVFDTISAIELADSQVLFPDLNGNTAIYNGQGIVAGVFNPTDRTIVETSDYEATNNYNEMFSEESRKYIADKEYIDFYVKNGKLYLGIFSTLSRNEIEALGDIPSLIAEQINLADGSTVEFDNNLGYRYDISEDTFNRHFGRDSLAARIVEEIRKGNVENLEDFLNDLINNYGPVLGKEQRGAEYFNSISDEEWEKIKGKNDELARKYGRKSGGVNAVAGRETTAKSRSEYEKFGNTINTIMSAEQIPEDVAKQFLKYALTDLNATYTVSTDKAAIKYAEETYDEYMDKYGEKGLDKLVEYEWRPVIDGNKRVDKKTIALGEKILMEAAHNRRADITLQVGNDLIVLGTELGQAVQALSLLKKMTPSGKLYYLSRVVNRLNKRYAKEIKSGKMNEIVVNESLALNVYFATEDTIDEAVRELEQDIANQIPVTGMERWNSWRYFAMLFNPRTHIRNLAGNGVFMPAIFLKRLYGVAFEGMLDESLRTKAVFISKEYMDFAKAMAKEDEKTLRGESKFNKASDLMSMRHIWGTSTAGKMLEGLMNWNTDALEAEDWLFLSHHYSTALASYLQKKGADISTLRNTPDGVKLLNEARMYAINEAQKATYRDFNSVAATLNAIKRSGGKLGFMVEALDPFTKTPLNILERAKEYSPIGLAMSIKPLITSLRAYSEEESELNRILATQAINDFCAGMSGTTIMLLGWLLASMGILIGSGGDDDKEKDLKSLQGYQTYSINIFNKATYTIDWTAPVAIPLFLGVEFYNLLTGRGVDLINIGDALVTMFSPLTELSMLSGFNDALSQIKYQDFSSALMTFIVGAVESYVAQGIPTVGGAVARSIDPYRRTIYTDKNSSVPSWMQSFVQKSIMGKIPGLESQKTLYVDKWGRTTSKALYLRLFENFLSPGYLNFVNETAADTEIARLYAATGNTSILPENHYKEVYMGADKGTKYLTSDEYVEAARLRGDTAYQLISELVSSAGYQSLESDDDKIAAISAAYDYASQTSKAELFGWENKNNWIDIATDFGVADYILLKSDIASNRTNDYLFELALTTPNLTDEQRGKLIAYKYSAPDTVIDSSSSAYQYTLSEEAAERADEIYYDTFMSNYEAISNSDKWKNASLDEQKEIIQTVRETSSEQTKEKLSAELKEDDMGSERTLRKASTVKQNGGYDAVYEVAINEPLSVTEQAEYIASSFSASNSRKGVKFDADMKAYQKKLYAEEFIPAYEAMYNSAEYQRAIKNGDTQRQKNMISNLHKTIQSETAVMVYNAYLNDEVPKATKSEIEEILEQEALENS